ncbi:BatD family protein [Flavobacterium selenitireducens]|uniref:BatD family protein n=1 Tax=Flavobacterium selenitireducens TaxID=2722704 RepID=UPI00168B7567|nr:BatD family protein [Flavobacterium selenitireducens]MBD3582055.1 protein BatD [Flavobacterium selenitireducens]
MKKSIFILFLFTQAVFAQVQFEAKVTKQTLGVNETLRVDFVMNDDGDNFTPPNFDGFRIVGGPSQSVSQSWVNGRSSFQKSYIYFLMPTQKGTLTIRSASIDIRGQVYKTNPVKINVTNAVQRPRQPGEPEPVNVDDAIHLVAEISKTNPYINEPITVVYKLYLSYNVGISNWRELEKPKYNDFWSQNIDIKQLVAEQGTFNGEPVRYVVLRKTVLYPQKSGKLIIEPLSLDLDIQVPTGRRDWFGRPQIVQDNKRVSAGVKTINVRALPEAGKPEDFSGAVGSFDFNVKPSKTMLKNGESLDLTVSVSGKGNLKLFDLPKPVVPSALEMYDPVHKENVQTPLSGMTGRVSDTYTIVPTYKGNYPIKPMSFSYFDIKSGRYKTITSPEIMIKVLDGPGAPQSGDAVAASGAGKQQISAGDQFKFIKLKTQLVPTKKKDFFGSGLFYGLLVAPFVIIPIIILARRKKEAIDRDVTGNRLRTSSRLVKKYLSEARRNISDKEKFYIALERALHNFLKAKLGIETSEMSKDRIRELLLSRNAQPQTVDNFIKLTEDCEFARYAPASSTAIQHDYEKAATIISELEKQIQ